MPGEQLKQLAKPVPRRLISTVTKGNRGSSDYIAHYDIIQLLLGKLDTPYSWEISPPYDSGNPAVDKNGDRTEGVAVIGTLTVVVDGKQYTVQGVGQARDMKKADSDALKRCAMKLGLGLELWCKGTYWLYDLWDKDSPAE